MKMICFFAGVGISSRLASATEPGSGSDKEGRTSRTSALYANTGAYRGQSE